MKTSKQPTVLFLGLTLCMFSMADAQELRGDTYLTPVPESDSHYAATLATVDRYLLEALQASDESVRRTSLRVAQTTLETMELHPNTVTGTSEVSTDSAEWLAQTERKLGLFQEQTRKELRESLMHKLWESPYERIPVDDFTALQTISDALRLLHEILRLEGVGNDALEHLQATYWGWLMSYRQAAGFDNTVLLETEYTPVFEQQVMRGKDGDVELYQLTGTEDRTLHWAQVPGKDLPRDLLTSEAMTIDLSRENATWLLVMDGEGLAEDLLAHQHWLEAIEQKVRMVLLERGAYSAALQTLPPEWFGPNRRSPYVLPASSNNTPEQLHLVHVADKRILGSWPLSSLGSSSGTAVKDLINRILAAANPQ